MKKVLLTGASGGLGLYLAKALLKNDYFVYLHYCTNATFLLSLKKEYPNQCEIVKADFQDFKEVTSFCEFMKKKKVDILINNAAIEHLSPLNEKDYDTLMKILKVNLVAPFTLMKELIDTVDVVVNISSDNAIDKYDMVTLEYDISKNSLNFLGKEFTREYPDKKINTLCFGWLDTSMNDFPEDIKEKLSFVSLSKATAKVLEYMTTNETGKIEVIR
uniref:SDR family oxidoreductase n=1 Tax=Candidatus Ventrenecus sp. TaxID=3085654 RepID=UPI003FF0607A